MVGKIKIQDILPHRYPFLLVDKMVELVPGERAVGIKNVTNNEPFFQGHFPGEPIMPGVLIVEALAQVGAVALLCLEENKNKLALFTGVDRFRFKKMVLPGDVLRLQVTLTGMKAGFGKGQAEATVEGKVAASGNIMFALVPRGASLAR
ncbi:MAG: 3-hydroxyacyl-ACP dehydratase FabZ [Firmicutes bacterium]|nr:3-hydroxyacyl-ACP dehydratase FabZ [Bacillota bacterium]